MQYNTKDLINFASSKNATDFTSALNNILASKLQNGLGEFQEKIQANIFRTGYRAHNPDEQRFVDKHIPSVIDYPVDNKDGLPFRDDSLDVSGPANKTPASYDKGKDEDVYESKQEIIDERKVEKDPAIEQKKRERISAALKGRMPDYMKDKNKKGDNN